MVEWWNGRMADRQNGGMRNGGMVEMAEWRNGGMAEWRNGGMAKWRDGRNRYLPTSFMVHADDDTDTFKSFIVYKPIGASPQTQFLNFRILKSMVCCILKRSHSS